MLARVAVFLDYSSITAACQRQQITINYRKLLDWLASESVGRKLVYAVAYVMTNKLQCVHEIEDIETRLGGDGYVVKTIICEHESRTSLGFEIIMDMVKNSYEFEPQIIVLVNNEVNNEIRHAIDYLVRETNTHVEIANFSGDQPQGCINRIALDLASDAISRIKVD